jgi:hypothetical protein
MSKCALDYESPPLKTFKNNYFFCDPIAPFSHSKNVEIIDILVDFFFYKIQFKLVFVPKKTFLYFKKIRPPM